MKPDKNADQMLENENCSCTSCVYKSASDRPSLRRFITKGSRIDKLYYGKYIPLRERKLLERLVRTRGVYDDIRAQLISDSTLSSNKPDLNPEKRLPAKELQKENNSSAILELINMVDKGADLGSKKLSDCCSCCSCSSKIHVHEQVKKNHRLRRGHAGGRAYEYGYIKEKVGGEHRKKRGVRFKSKHIRSDPCFCTLKFSGMIKNQSKSLLKKIRRDHSVPALEIIQTTDENVKRQNKLHKLSRASYEKVKETNARVKELVTEGARKVKESKNIIGENIRANSKRSLEKIKDAKNKLKQNILTEVRKSYEAKDKEKDLLTTCLCPEKELFLKIKKDSVSKFKDDLKKKQLMKYWECEPECVKDTCVPEECFKKLKLRNSRRTKSRKRYDKDMRQDAKIGDLINKSDVHIQSQNQLINTKTGTDRQKHFLHTDRTQEIVGPRLSFEAKSKNKTAFPNLEIGLKKDKNNICECDNISLLEKQDVTYNKNNVIKSALPPPAIPKTIKEKPIKEEKEDAKRPEIRSNVNEKHEKIRIMEPPLLVQTKPEQKRSHRQAVRIGSSFSFNVEFYKERRSCSNASHTESTYRGKKDRPAHRHKTNKGKKAKKRRQKGSQVKLSRLPKNSQSGSHALKRCFCTLKLKSKKNKQKNKKLEKGTSSVTSGSPQEGSPFRKDLNFVCSKKPCKKEPSRCYNQLCDSLEHHKRQQNRTNEIGINTELKTKKVVKLSKSGKRKKEVSQLLPYECKPGVCVPGACNPKECIKLINKRERKKKVKDTASGSYQCSCKTKSTSSLTTNAIVPLKVKQVQSNIATQNSTPKVSRERVKIPQKNSSIKNRQAVRVGSSFSFNIEFYKEKVPATSTPTNVKSITFKPRAKQKVHPKKHSIHKKKSTPTQINKKEHNAHMGTTLKRCFCTLKLQKKESTKRKNKMPSTGTNTVNPEYMTIEMSTKGTKINRKDRNLLEPFECEPYTCIPGACDPYICLERINKRNILLKNIGLTTTSPIMVTESSSTELEKENKPVQIKFKQPSKSHKTLTKPYIKKQYRKNEKQFGSGDSSLKSKRAVRLGSSFSFDIQFYKDRYQPPYRPIKYQVDEVPLKKSTNKKFKNKGIKKKVSDISHIDTQVKVDGHNKASLVKPMLKKCFCTLNLVKKQNKQFRRTDISKNKHLPIIYTVNKVITANTMFSTCVDSAIKRNSQNFSLRNKFCDKYINLETAATNSKTVYEVKPHKLEKENMLYSDVNYTLEHTINESLEKYSMHRKPVESREGLVTNTLKNTKQYEKKSYEKQLNCLSFRPELTGLHRYLRQYYYAMNVQTKNIQKISKRNKPIDKGYPNRNNRYNGRKLEPYECEPGICVPGQCNPYDCQKLILERMKKHNTKKLGTYSTSRTTSSYTGPNRIKLGSNKTQNTEKYTMSHVKKNKPESIKHSNKQAVRLGSSFSFDIEFFKDKSNVSKQRIEPKYSSDTKIVRRVKQRHKKFKSSSTKGQGINSVGQESQSGSLMADKASHTITDTKRCFCTLKLQKKGRLYKEHVKKDKMTKMNKDPNINVTMSTRGQNTVKIKPVKVKRKLDPYECEPGICVPGYCDPYKCLELMKLKRTEGQQFGTNTTNSGNSVSSMTMSANNKHRDRAIGVRTKRGHSKPTLTRRYKENKVPETSRQCVRIGSSFSFNVEFYKDNPNILKYKENLHKPYTQERNSLPVRNKKIMEQKGSQNYKDLKHMDSQINISPLNASTMTKSRLKRCFCTAQLQAQNVMQQSQTKDPGTFKKRCMCVLKLLKKSNLRYRPEKNRPERKAEISKPPMATKKVNTRNKKNNKTKERSLEPYECWPGICVPGECNPYKCYEIMNKKKIDTYSRGSVTSSINTRPIASHTSEVLKKDRKTQMMRTKVARTKQEAYIKTPHDRVSDRQAVKIGSNFSFNIEFYKQNISAFNGKSAAKLETYENVHPSGLKVKKLKIKNTGSNVRPLTFSTANTQAVRMKKENRAIGAKPLLKRCFCVLKLQNQRKQNHKNKDIKITKPKSKKMETKSVMTVEKDKWHSDKLEPYECEPNVCIPYQCDPVECEKLIKERLKQQKNRTKATQQRERSQKIKWRPDKLLPYECEPNVCIPYECDPYECEKRIQERLKKGRHRDSGTSTNRQRITKASITDKFVVPKMKNQHTLHKAYASHKRQSKGIIKNESSVHPSRQSVKIGSSFTFNIEFYKNKDGIDVVKLPKSDNVRALKSNFKENKKIQKQVKQRGSQKLRDNRQNKIIQFENEITKSQATMTNVSPFSNRCFCTLYVRKPRQEKRQEDIPRVMATSDISTETNKPDILKLLPYECEPQVCIPGECNPLECLERIKMRKHNRKNVGLTTINDSKSVGSAITGVNTKSKNKNIQTKHIALKNNVAPESRETKGLNVEAPRKQVVRIGSNFSFDIEFYKDRIIDSNLNKLSNRQEEVINLAHETKTTQDVNSISHIKTQVMRNATKSLKSGISPILKRCFCTLKLRKTAEKHSTEQKSYSAKKSNYIEAISRNEGKNNMTNQTPPNILSSGAIPYMKKCFCNFKLHMLGNKQKENYQKNEDKNLKIKINKNTVHSNNQRLQPYECEPGVCVPGLCNPYECEKLIQKRFLRALSTQTRQLNKHFATNQTDHNNSDSVMTQSNQEKYHIFKPKNDMLSSKRLENTQEPSFINNVTNRQAVHIGSNFDFNIEFFKDSVNPGITVPLPNKNNKKTKLTKDVIQHEKKNQFINKNISRNKASQSTHGNKKSKGSSIMPVLQRCFCTLKLNKSQKNAYETIKNKPIVKSQSVATKNQTILPEKIPINFQYLEPYECEPFTCVPGECDPYECEKRIKMRGLTKKSQTTATQNVKFSPKSVGLPSRSLKTQKIQSDFSDYAGKLNSSIQKKQEQRFVEVPRFPNFANNNAIRIGSNFNFNIEFYKETVPQTVVVKTGEKLKDKENLEHITQKPIYTRNKGVVNTGGRLKTQKLQNDPIKSDEKYSETENKLKRCFCSLKLQKKEFSKEMSDKIMYPVLINKNFPQVFDVRRVTVEKTPKNLTNAKKSDVKSVGTKVNAKLLNQCVCQTGRNDDMHTILPYVPSKFNKKGSKTLLATYDRYKEESNISKPNKTSLNKGRKLTRKKSHKSINKRENKSLAPLEVKNNNHSSFFHRLFCKCANNIKQNANIAEIPSCDVDTCEFQKQDNGVRHHKRLSGSTKTKTSKSLKVLKKQEKNLRSSSINKNKTHSNIRVADSDRCPRTSINKNHVIFNDLQENHMNAQTNHRGQKLIRSTILKHGKGNGEHNDTLCSQCEMQFKKKVHFQDSTSLHKQRMNRKISNKSNKKYELPPRNTESRITSKKLLKNSQKISKSCNYCDLCGGRVNKEEIQKGAGDLLQSKLLIQKANEFLVSTSDKIKSLFNFDDNDNICSGEMKIQEPLFEMKLDSQDYGIINKDEVVHSVTMLKNKIKKDHAKAKREQLIHGKSCRCCICLGKKQKGGAKLKVTAKGSKATGLFGNLFGGDTRFATSTPHVTKSCVCGSEVCAKELKNMSTRQQSKTQKQRWKPCACGSPVCKYESDMIKILASSPDKIMCECMQEIAKRKTKLLNAKMKEEAKKRAIRSKKYKKEDEVRKKRRLKQNIFEEKSVKQNAKQNNSDLLLLAESVLDMARLGITATSDTVRCAARTAIDPKGTLSSITALKEDPTLFFRGTKNAISESGVASTLRRIKYRWGAMRAVSDAKSLMEQHPLTNFLLHISDKNGDRRAGLKKKRVRERFDFSCSLYMAALRKRPCLCIYDRCPWFYPHFMSVLNVWRQFSDIVLFLIAVVVWSPCILAMELCRAMMCCFLCTG